MEKLVGTHTVDFSEENGQFDADDILDFEDESVSYKDSLAYKWLKSIYDKFLEDSNAHVNQKSPAQTKRKPKKKSSKHLIDNLFFTGSSSEHQNQTRKCVLDFVMLNLFR